MHEYLLVILHGHCAQFDNVERRQTFHLTYTGLALLKSAVISNNNSPATNVTFLSGSLITQLKHARPILKLNDSKNSKCPNICFYITSIRFIEVRKGIGKVLINNAYL